jgi:hypothetical protein
MKLIEKIVDKFLNDGDYAVGLMLFSFLTIFLLSTYSMVSYHTKLATEVQLAKIAAGQMVEDKK